MTPAEKKDTEELLAESEAILTAIDTAVRQALLDHKRAGNPVAAWENGRVVWIPPEQILAEDDAGPSDPRSAAKQIKE